MGPPQGGFAARFARRDRAQMFTLATFRRRAQLGSPEIEYQVARRRDIRGLTPRHTP